MFLKLEFYNLYSENKNLKNQMYIKTLVTIGILVMLSVLATPVAALEVAYGSNPQTGCYLNVGDAKICYEVHGEGRPVLLLQGGLYGYIDEYSPYIPELSKHFKVIAMATRGHGRSEIGKTVSFHSVCRRCRGSVSVPLFFATIKYYS